MIVNTVATSRSYMSVIRILPFCFKLPRKERYHLGMRDMRMITRVCSHILKDLHEAQEMEKAEIGKVLSF